VFASVVDRFRWIDCSTRLLAVVRGLRNFGQSAVAIILALYLGTLGFSLLQIGLVLSVDIAGTTALALSVAFLANKIGRRRMLAGIMFAAALASVVVALTRSLPILVVAIFVGSFTAGAGAGGPLQPLEVAAVAEVAPADKRTRLMATLFMVGTVASAIGALLVAFPPFAERSLHISLADAYRAMFILYAAIQAASGVLYSRLPEAVEGKMARQFTNPLRLRSRRRIFALTALFAMDGFGGALILQSLAAYWFNTRFGLTLGSLSAVFFVSSVLAAISLWAAAKIADRIGLLNTMVFTHIPSSLFLIAAAFSPVAWMAVLFWQLRSLLGQMDIPARESYTMAIVEPEERVAMGAVGGVGRSGASILGPIAGTALWNGISAAAPFIGCGLVKIAYDISLFFTFRNLKTPEEGRRERVSKKAMFIRS
jgi:MFS family permease